MDEQNPGVPPPLPPPLEPPPLAVSADDGEAPTNRPWGFWATVGWTLLIGIAVAFAQTAAVVAYAAWCSVAGGKTPSAEEITSSGFVLSLSTILGAPVAVGLSICFARLRKGMNVRDYLGLRWPGKKTIVLWCLAMLGFMAVSDTVTVLLGKPVVPDVMKELYRGAQIVPLFWLAIVVAAPIAEEVLFRGFLLTGLQHSRAGATAAVLLSAAVWAAIHLQYDFYGIGMIFITGIILGIVRVTTGSTLLCILLHALQNLIATIEVVVSLSLAKA